MAMPVVIMPARAVMREPDRLQFDIGYTGRDVQPGLALHADRLQRVGVRRTADQKIAAETDADRCIGADATVVAREFAASNPLRRCIHRPGEIGLASDTEIHPETADGRDIGFGTAALALEHAIEAGRRSDDEADILAALALQDTRTHRR